MHQPSSQPSIVATSSPFSMTGAPQLVSFVRRCVYGCAADSDHKRYIVGMSASQLSVFACARVLADTYSGTSVEAGGAGCLPPCIPAFAGMTVMPRARG